MPSKPPLNNQPDWGFCADYLGAKVMPSASIILQRSVIVADGHVGAPALARMAGPGQARRMLLWLAFESAVSWEAEFDIRPARFQTLLAGPEQSSSEPTDRARVVSRAGHRLDREGVIRKTRRGRAELRKALSVGARLDFNPTCVYPVRRPDRPHPTHTFEIPVSFWSNGWLSTLSQSASTVLLVLAADRANRRPVSFRNRHRQFGVSDEVWERGFADLEHHSLARRSTRPNTKQSYTYELDLTRLVSVAPGRLNTFLAGT